jgi:hypothetical protein
MNMKTYFKVQRIAMYRMTLLLLGLLALRGGTITAEPIEANIDGDISTPLTVANNLVHSDAEPIPFGADAEDNEIESVEDNQAEAESADDNQIEETREFQPATALRVSDLLGNTATATHDSKKNFLNS